MEIVRCNEKDYETLAGIWERSVMATHDFLKKWWLHWDKSCVDSRLFPKCWPICCCRQWRVCWIHRTESGLYRNAFYRQWLSRSGLWIFAYWICKTKRCDKGRCKRTESICFEFLQSKGIPYNWARWSWRRRSAIPDSSSIPVKMELASPGRASLW